MCVTVSSEPHCHGRFCRASYERSATRFTSQLQLCGMHSLFVRSARGIFVDFCGPPRRRCSQIRDLRALSNARCASVSRMGCIVWVASFAFARVLVAVMCLLQFFGRLCWYCAHTSIVGTRRRLRTSPEGVAPATSGVLVQVFIVLHRFAFAHGFQCQCSGCIPVVFLCARPVTPQIRNGNAQRHNARLLIASSSLCAVASSVWLFRGILCTHPLPIHCPRPTDSLGRIRGRLPQYSSSTNNKTTVRQKASSEPVHPLLDVQCTVFLDTCASFLSPRFFHCTHTTPMASFSSISPPRAPRLQHTSN
jgi:hypothetical protein